MERRRGLASEDKVCHTCGHTGFADSIATCSLCKVSMNTHFFSSVSPSSRTKHNGVILVMLLYMFGHHPARRQMQDKFVRLIQRDRSLLQYEVEFIMLSRYCMSSVRFQVPEEWRCEECLRSAEVVSKRHLPAHQFSPKRPWRKIEAGKVKFISNEEVVTLTSLKRSHGSGNPSASGHRSDFAYVKPPSISWKTVAPTLPCSKAIKTHFTPKKGSVSAVIDIKPSEHTMQSKPVSKEKGRASNAQVCKMEPVVGKASTLACNVSSKPSEVIFDTVDTLRADDGQISMDKHIENKAPLKPQDNCLFVEKPAKTSIVIKEERDLHNKSDANVQPVHDSGTAVHSIPQFSQISSKKMLLPLKLVISSNEKLHHAVEACWRGAFEVVDLVTQFHGPVNGHLPCQVSSKVYDASKCLPGTLQFKIHSRERVWPKIFKLNPPTEDDVALYFRCESERHKENYAHFIQHIDSNDYALQGFVADVELLLFTSAQLQIDSQKFDGDIYLWGVFRHFKQKKAIHGDEKAVSSNPSAPHGHSEIPRDVSSLEIDMKVDMPQGSSLEREVDMEIDMLGGWPIGRIDVPIKIEDVPSGFSKAIQRSPLNFGLKKYTNSHSLGTPPGFPIPAYKRTVPAPRDTPTKDLVSSNTTRNYG